MPRGESRRRGRHLALAWVRTDESELQLARELLRRAEQQQASYDSKVLGAVLSLLRARLLWSEGDFELALAELREPVNPGPGLGLLHRARHRVAGRDARGRRGRLAAGARAARGVHRAAAALEDGDNIAARLVRNHALAATGADPTPARHRSGRSLRRPPRPRSRGGSCWPNSPCATGIRPAREELLERALRIAATEHLRRPSSRPARTSAPSSSTVGCPPGTGG